jgi:hypothetical protein
MSYNRSMASTIADKIRAFAREKYIRPAKVRGEQRVTILAGDLVRELGLENRTPAVCSALRSLIFQRENGIELASADGPPSGNSTTMRYTYIVPTQEHVESGGLQALRGAGSDVFRSLGGSEAFIREERKAFGGS